MYALLLIYVTTLYRLRRFYTVEYEITLLQLVIWKE